MTTNSWFLHVDLDAFFASVEQLDHPEYRGKPVIVGGLPTDRRSVVSTASYEARKYGVHSAMPTAQAYHLCPHGIYVHGNMQRYAELSYKIMMIFRQYSPDVLQMSIDEAFIDITGTEKLFGPPEETALKIKQDVKKQTGLTVSVGLATTKYLAKIASAMSKPDGFYFIKPGTEQDFMLSLPLDKVWGLGKKSLEKLNKSGIYSTKDIYEKDYDTLEFLYGNNMADFLYNVVRGNNQDSFSRNAKNHSLSAETTFPYDITDIYTIETSILELAHGVFFRLMKENGFSKTVFVKIRYDDFTTTSSQKTYSSNISTLDTFYEYLTELFEEKYKEGRGVRLIGIGFDNIVNEKSFEQQELFENNNAKKQKVEKAIFNLSQKHPEIKVHKARLLEKEKKQPCSGNNSGKLKSITLLLFALFFSRNQLKAQAIYDYDINDKNHVEFELNGEWEAELKENLTLALNPMMNPAFSAEIPVFTQKVKLSAKAMLNQSIFFLADFEDEFKKNTFTFGYYGKNYLKSAVLSNRNISMEGPYSADFFGYGLTGGANQAPGISLHFEDKDYNKWAADFLVRYDLLSTESAVFYGMNTVTDLEYSLKEFLYGDTYFFPSAELLSQVKAIYVENKNGTYTDNIGKKYKKLSASDFRIYPETKKIILEPSAQASRNENYIPSVLITFIDSSKVSSALSELGTYKSQSSYLGQIQSFFDKSGKKYDLEKYSYKLERQIENSKAIVLQNTVGFSPFLVCNKYDCGISKEADVLVVSSSSDKESTVYSAETVFSDEVTSSTDFFNDSRIYAQISNLNYSAINYSSPELRYPFADSNPEIYLNLIQDSDLKLIVRSYSPVQELYIDSDASAGTVMVYINGILEPSAKYNPETGSITLGKTVSQTDKIYITWSKDSSDFTNGSFAAGAGVIVNFLPALRGDFSLTGTVPFLIQNTYSSYQNMHPAFAALSTGITCTAFEEKLTLSNKTSVALTTDDTTGLYSAINQSKSQNQTYYHNASDGYKTKNAPHINSQNANISLSEKFNGTAKNHTGITDSYITGYKIPLYWDFSRLDMSDEYGWAGVDLKLLGADNLTSAAELELALQPSGIQDSVCDVYFQLGIKTSDSSSADEESLPVWKITDFSDSKVLVPLDLSKNSWQVVKIKLSDEDRSRLCSSHDGRIIVISKNRDSKGTIYAGPYQCNVQNTFLSHSNKIITSTQEVTNQGSSVLALMNNKLNYSTKINWQYDSNTDFISPDESQITAVTYFNKADFSSYKSINYDFAFEKTLSSQKSAVHTSNDSYDFELILDADAYNSQKEGNIAVRFSLNDISPWISQNNSVTVYHTLSINTLTKQVFIDGVELSPEQYSLYINTQVIPNREKIIINTQNSREIIKKGCFYNNSLYFKDSKPSIMVQNNVQTVYKTENNEITLSSTQYSKNELGTVSNIQYGNTIYGMNSTVNVSKKISDVIFAADTSLRVQQTNYLNESENNNGITNAGHNISTEKPLFKIFSFEDKYRFNPEDKQLSKVNSLKTDFNSYNIPLLLDFSTSAKDSLSVQNQTALSGINFAIPVSDYSVDFKFLSEFSQKINTHKNNITTSSDKNYVNGWSTITTTAFSSGSESAYNRNEQYSGIITGKIPYFGLEPSFKLQLQNVYTNQSETKEKNSTELSFNLPATFSNNYIKLSISKKLTGLFTAEKGGNYQTDSADLFEHTKKQNWFYSTIPVYDLFDQNIKNSMISERQSFSNESITNESFVTETALLYTSDIALLWKRKLYNTSVDFFIPNRISAEIQRDISQSESTSDLYQYKAQLSHNAFTKQFEFNSNLSGAYKLPCDKPENSLFTGNVFLEVLYYLSDFNTLRSAIDFTMTSSFDFEGKTSIIWERPGKTSFIISAINFLIPVSQKTVFNISRKNSLSVSFSKSDSSLKQKYELLHYTQLNFLKNFYVTLGMGGNYSNTITASSKDLKEITQISNAIGAQFSLGLKMEF